jgi:hypothetical protein
VLYGAFSNTNNACPGAYVASVAAGCIAVAHRYSNGSGSSAQAFGCWDIGIWPYLEGSGGTIALGTPIGATIGGKYQQPIRPGGNTCYAAEISGFFSGLISPTNYANSTDTGLLCFTANMDNQPYWNCQGYCWNWMNSTTPNVDQLVNWGSNQNTGYCDWNEHFHQDGSMQFMIFFSSHGYGAEGSSWDGCSASAEGETPPLDAWQTRLSQFADSAGQLHLTSAEVLQGDVGSTRLTFLNVAGTPDSRFFCAQTNPINMTGVDCSLGAWGGGDGQYGPNGVFRDPQCAGIWRGHSKRGKRHRNDFEVWRDVEGAGSHRRSGPLPGRALELAPGSLLLRYKFPRAVGRRVRPSGAAKDHGKPVCRVGRDSPIEEDWRTLRCRKLHPI